MNAAKRVKVLYTNTPPKIKLSCSRKSKEKEKLNCIIRMQGLLEVVVICWTAGRMLTI